MEENPKSETRNPKLEDSSRKERQGRQEFRNVLRTHLPKEFLITKCTKRTNLFSFLGYRGTEYPPNSSLANLACLARENLQKSSKTPLTISDYLTLHLVEKMKALANGHCQPFGSRSLSVPIPRKSSILNPQSEIHNSSSIRNPKSEILPVLHSFSLLLFNFAFLIFTFFPSPISLPWLSPTQCFAQEQDPLKEQLEQDIQNNSLSHLETNPEERAYAESGNGGDGGGGQTTSPPTTDTTDPNQQQGGGNAQQTQAPGPTVDPQEKGNPDTSGATTGTAAITGASDGATVGATGTAAITGAETGATVGATGTAAITGAEAGAAVGTTGTAAITGASDGAAVGTTGTAAPPAAATTDPPPPKLDNLQPGTQPKAPEIATNERTADKVQDPTGVDNKQVPRVVDPSTPKDVDLAQKSTDPLTNDKGGTFGQLAKDAGIDSKSSSDTGNGTKTASAGTGSGQQTASAGQQQPKSSSSCPPGSSCSKQSPQMPSSQQSQQPSGQQSQPPPVYVLQPDPTQTQQQQTASNTNPGTNPYTNDLTSRVGSTGAIGPDQLQANVKAVQDKVRAGGFKDKNGNLDKAALTTALQGIISDAANSFHAGQDILSLNDYNTILSGTYGIAKDNGIDLSTAIASSSDSTDTTTASSSPDLLGTSTGNVVSTAPSTSFSPQVGNTGAPISILPASTSTSYGAVQNNSSLLKNILAIFTGNSK